MLILLEVSLLRVALITAQLIACGAGAQTPGFWLTGVTPGASGGSALGLSQDGGVAVGQSGNGDITPGFWWTRSGGRYDFGLEPGMPPHSPAFGTNSDGSVIVGWMLGPGMTGRHAYRRIASGLPQDLGVLPGEARSYAAAVSADGATVVGTSEHTVPFGNHGQAFRWAENTGMVGLGYLRPNGTLSEANGISRDGSTIVGMSQSNGVAGIMEAFRWTQSAGMVALPPLGGPILSSEAFACTADGSIVVGVSPDAVSGNDRPVRWTPSGIEDLGILPGFVNGRAFAVSDDGSVVGGTAHGGGMRAAIVWTPATGMEALREFLARQGVLVPSEWRLDYIYAISGDGLTFAGSAWNLTTNRPEGFIATIPSPGAVVVLLAAPLLCSRRRRG